MTSLEEKLQKWIVHETDGLCEGRMAKIPDISTLSRLTEGKNKKIWKYFTERVKSRQSVQNIRSILRLKRAQTELHHIYPRTVKRDTIALKQEIVNSQEKVQFVENSIKDIKSYIFSVKDSVQKLKEEACILNQKCTLLELVALNYHEKNETVKNNLQYLCLLLSYVLRDEKMHFQKFLSEDLLHKFNSNKINSELYNTKMKNILYEISTALENRLIKNNLEGQTIDWNKSISELTCCISLNNVVHLFKELSRQSETTLKSENIASICISHSHKEISEKYLQKLKFEHIRSYFNKMKVTNDISNLSSLDNEQSSIQIILQKLTNPTHREFLLVKSENESLIESIKCLEEALVDIFNKTKYLVGKNDEQRAHCEHLKAFMQEFYRKLQTIRSLLDANRQTFLDIHKALLASSEFMFTNLFNNISTINLKFLSDAKSEMKFDFETSMKLMKKNDCIQPLLKKPNFKCSNVPEIVWESINIPIYQNRQLMISEKLIHLKKELSQKIFIFDHDNNVDIEEKHLTMLSQLQNIINHSKVTEKEYIKKIKECRKNLEVTMNEWWVQKAQFIPEINCQGKSLKMWLDVLQVLDEI